MLNDQMGSGKRVIGIIGGSGFYQLVQGGDTLTHQVDTPWGAPSAAIIQGKIGEVEVLFLARHGIGHQLPPGEINYRANIDALKQLGATDIISVSSCGSLREDLPPTTFVLVDQYIDRTTTREKSFFDEGFVAHVSMADPVCPALQRALVAACSSLDIPYHDGGVYICMDGPQFSSRAESHMYRQWGCDVIGMTNMPEAKLAREAELPYATVAMVTDYDCWRENEKAVEVSDLLAVMHENTRRAEKLIVAVAEILGGTRSPSPLGIETALDMAVITSSAARSENMTTKLKTIAGRYLAAQEK